MTSWLVLALAVAGGWLATRGRTAVAAAAIAELELRSLDIRFYEARVARDPWSAADLAQLAGLYLQRARETGDYEDFRRSEAAARRSLALRTARNGKGLHQLAASLLAQHKFEQARQVAEQLVAADSGPPSYRALLAEIQLELGRYAEARRTFASLRDARTHLAVAPRLARWAEITGRPDEARRLLLAARDTAMTRSDLPREQVAWFHLRVADLELRDGCLWAAERALEAGLRVAPHDPRLLALGAQLEAARRRWRRAVVYGERAVARSADVATLGLLGDAYAALGDSARAEAQWSAAERLGLDRPEPFNRMWTLFLLEHGRRLPETRVLLEREITVRPDVYGYDQLAWARYLTGDRDGARRAMRQALRLGTRDAMLYFHAAKIEEALGHREAAEDYCRVALDINPVVHTSVGGRRAAGMGAGVVIVPACAVVLPPYRPSEPTGAAPAARDE